MPLLNPSASACIKRTPNLKRMQLEKERLSMVDAENARLLGRITRLKVRKAREFTRSSAAEDVLPLVLQRRKRERVRKARLVCQENERLKRRIDKIKGGRPPPKRPAMRKSGRHGGGTHHRKARSIRLGNNGFDQLVQSRGKRSTLLPGNAAWEVAHRAGVRLPTTPPGATTASFFLVTVSQTTLPTASREDAIRLAEHAALRFEAYDMATGTTFRRDVNAAALQLFFGGFRYWFPATFADRPDRARLSAVYFASLVSALRLDPDARSYMNSRLTLLRPHAVVGARGAKAVRGVKMLAGRWERDARRRALDEEAETYDFSPRLRRTIVVSRLSPAKQGEKRRMLSARKAVLKDVLAHTASVAALGGGSPSQGSAAPTTAPPRPPPRRRIRSRQRRRRQVRGKRFVQSLEQRVRPAAPGRPAAAPATDVTMETEEERRAVLKLQAIQRGRSTRRAMETKRAGLAADRRGRAAAKIQALHRGVLARGRFKVRLETAHEMWRRDYMLRAVFKDGDLNEDGVLQVREFAAMLRDVSSRGGGGQAPTPSLLEVKNLMRRINAQYGIGVGEQAAGGPVEIGEECFVSYFLSGLGASARELAIFARGGTYHRMLATLVVQMRQELGRRTAEERMAASYAIFDKYDDDRSGTIDTAEMKTLIADYMGRRGRQYAPSSEEVEVLMRSLDRSGDMLLDREEFQQFLMGGLARSMADRKHYSRRSKMHRKLAMLLDRISMGIDRRTKALHTLFDEGVGEGEKGGFLQADQLKRLIAATMGRGGGREKVDLPDDDEVLSFLRLMDDNGDLKLSKAEFVLFMLHNDDILDEKESRIAQWRRQALETIPW
jgi:Ca2+-binding EF-hand superfamily protein